VPETIIIYGTQWCGDCWRTRRFFDQNHIPYQWINIDQDKTAEQYVINFNKGNRSVPTIRFPDGSHLVEPSRKELNAKLSISYELSNS
jgi:mycoredoxin